MYRPVKLEATNFQSFKSLSYDFKPGKAILIEGENRTDDGQATNGSGKSGFAEMIYYSLLGSSSNGKRDIKLVRRGCKEASLCLVLKNEYLKQELTIKRTLFANTKPSTLEIFINGEDMKGKYATVNEGNKFILDCLDISQDDLKNYYLINKKRFVSFFDSPDSAKRALLGRFSNIDRVQKVGDEIDIRLKERQEEINSKNSLILACQSKIDLLNEQIEAERGVDKYKEKQEYLQGVIASNKTRQEEIDEELKEVERDLFTNQKDMQENDKSIESANKRIKDLQSIDYDSQLTENSKEQALLQEKIDGLRKKKTSYLDDMGDLKKSLQPVLVMLEGVVTCPNCKTEFAVGHEDIDIEEMKEIVKDTENTIQELREEMNKMETKIQEESNSSAVKDLKLRRTEILNEKQETQNKISEIKTGEINPLVRYSETLQNKERQLKDKRIRLNSEQMSCAKRQLDAEKELESLTQETINPDIEKWEKQKEEYEKQKEEIEKEVIVLEQKSMNDRQWKERVNQFYVYLTNKTLTLIQSHCNHYLSTINSDLKIKFEGFKTLADGKVKESINAVIQREGEEEEDYRCFSGGEQGRLIFSTILTYQELINQKSKSGGLDAMVVDEILDQVDSEGMGLFVQSMRGLDKTVFIISQVKTEAPVDNVLLIVKEDNESRICE